MSLTLLTPPTSDLVVTLTEAKKQLRMEETTADDTFITSLLIPAARDRCELVTNRQLYTATWSWTLDAFPSCASWLELPKPPLQYPSVAYVDTNGTTRTWASTNYLVDAPSGPRCRRGRLALAYGISWPSTRTQINAVTITFTAGYGRTTTNLPPLLRQGMLLDIGTLYDNREDVIKGTIVELPTSAVRIYRSFRSYATQRLAA